MSSFGSKPSEQIGPADITAKVATKTTAEIAAKTTAEVRLWERRQLSCNWWTSDIRQARAGWDAADRGATMVSPIRAMPVSDVDADRRANTGLIACCKSNSAKNSKRCE